MIATTCFEQAERSMQEKDSENSEVRILRDLQCAMIEHCKLKVVMCRDAVGAEDVMRVRMDSFYDLQFMITTEHSAIRITKLTNSFNV